MKPDAAYAHALTRDVLNDIEDVRTALIAACEDMGREFEHDEQNVNISCNLVKAIAALEGARRNTEMARDALSGQDTQETAEVPS